MLDSCPVERSCGAGAPAWTDDKMHQRVGERLEIKFYWNYNNNCRYSDDMFVIRCSDQPNDFIYKQNGDTFIGGCWVAYCGMN